MGKTTLCFSAVLWERGLNASWKEVREDVKWAVKKAAVDFDVVTVCK